MIVSVWVCRMSRSVLGSQTIETCDSLEVKERKRTKKEVSSHSNFTCLSTSVQLPFYHTWTDTSCLVGKTTTSICNAFDKINRNISSSYPRLTFWFILQTAVYQQFYWTMLQNLALLWQVFCFLDKSREFIWFCGKVFLQPGGGVGVADCIHLYCKLGPCTLHHWIQTVQWKAFSMEGILACQPAVSTEWLDWVAIPVYHDVCAWLPFAFSIDQSHRMTWCSPGWVLWRLRCAVDVCQHKCERLHCYDGVCDSWTLAEAVVNTTGWLAQLGEGERKSRKGGEKKEGEV